MPTGYTADIKDGITFKQFALNCARAFGALILMRDEPAGAPIPERFHPSDYYAKASATAQLELTQLEAMHAKAAERWAEAAHSEAETRRLNRIAEKNDQKAKYEAMLVKVKAWVPPTPDHIPMRDFMISQIKESIEFDCTIYEETPTERLSGDAWRAQQIAKARHDIAYHDTEHAKEVERTNQRNAWVKTLRESLEERAP